VHIPKFRIGAGKVLANASTPDFYGTSDIILGYALKKQANGSPKPFACFIFSFKSHAIDLVFTRESKPTLKATTANFGIPLGSPRSLGDPVALSMRRSLTRVGALACRGKPKDLVTLARNQLHRHPKRSATLQALPAHQPCSLRFHWILHCWLEAFLSPLFYFFYLVSRFKQPFSSAPNEASAFLK
jgi:hypothetical protein